MFFHKYFEVNWTWLQNFNSLKPISVRVKHQQMLSTISLKIMPSTWEAESLTYFTVTTEPVDVNRRRHDHRGSQVSVQVTIRKR